MRLAFTDRGTGPVVVLLHGFPLNRSMWDNQVQALQGSYRVIAPDLRGHGESPAPDGVYEMESMAAEVVELLDGLEVKEPVALGGLSMGGYVALALTLKYPDRVRGLMLLDTKSEADSAEAAEGREASAKAIVEAGTASSVVEGMVPKLFAESTLKDNRELVERFRALMLDTPAAGVIGALRGMAVRPDQTGRLGEIKIPSLVIAGEHDAVTPPEGARRMAQALPSSQFEIIAGAGHLSPCENPEAVNAAILKFLSGLG